jgi:hypothetical protein
VPQPTALPRVTINNTKFLKSYLPDKMGFICFSSCWCYNIVLDVHAPTEDKIDDVRNNFYEELEHLFHKYPKCHMKILLDFNAKVGREGICKPTIGNQSLHKFVLIMELE